MNLINKLGYHLNEKKVIKPVDFTWQVASNSVIFCWRFLLSLSADSLSMAKSCNLKRIAKDTNNSGISLADYLIINGGLIGIFSVDTFQVWTWTIAQ